jgi:hypothetical protein
MYAMQYGVSLPADYDMQIMRDIVSRNGHLLDDRAGLGFKAYLMRERGVNDSPVNFYGSFYLWSDPGAMAQFLVGGGAFERIIRGLGRLAVDHWLGIACVAGRAREAAPKFASRYLTPLTEDLDREPDGLGLARRIEQECEALNSLAGREDVHTAALALDPLRWTLLKFVAWQDAVPPEEDASERYEVLHVSAPALKSLPNGRMW